jgi:hypothetical protein
MGRARQRKRNRPKPPRWRVLSNRTIGKWTLVVSTLALVAALVTYYLAYEGPDLRFVQLSDITVALPVIDNQGHCYYYVTAEQTFTNLSFKKGFVKDVQLSPGSSEAFSQINLISIDASPIRWHEQNRVRFKFGITTSEEFCKHPGMVPYKVLAYYYDQTGQRIQRDASGNRSSTDIDLAFYDLPQDH